MSQEMETILRKSLDDVDRVRKWQITGLVLFLLFFLLQVASVIGTLHKSGWTNQIPTIAALRVTLIAGVILMAYTVGFCTLGICIFISRMTKKILKAIELLSKP
jgi:hypothetical protein